MAVSSARFVVSIVLSLSSATSFAASHKSERSQPITLDAQSMDGDLANNNVVFRKIRISQGGMSISADQGHGQGQGQGQGAKQNTPDFDNSIWLFRGNVKISIEHGQLASDEATIDFARQQLVRAVANGKPAAFEELIEKTGKVAHGRADTIDYNADTGIVHLSKDAWLSNGDGEIRGDSLTYNVTAQSIVAEGTDANSQQVHIVIPPPPAKP